MKMLLGDHTFVTSEVTLCTTLKQEA